MAFVWVQQWVALPVVIEDPMGDIPSASGPPALGITAAGLAHDDHQARLHQPSSDSRPPSSNTPFHSQLSSIPQSQLRSDLRSSVHPTNPHYSQTHDPTPFNMGVMAGDLPDYGHSDGAQPPLARQVSGASTSALVYQLQQNLQAHTPASNSLPVQPGYGPGFGAGQFQHNYMPTHAPPHTNYTAFPPHQQQRGPGHNSMQGPYQNYAQQSPYMYYPAPYGAQPYGPGFAAQSAQNQALYGRRPSLTSSQIPPPGHGLDMSQQQDTMFSSGNRMVQGDPSSMGWVGGGHFVQPGSNARPGPVSSIPRGPPRKPKQSGHALWVGNLPPGTTVVALKDHFSRDATRDIESLFLISKSNCAFVNYRTEASCTAAMHRFHDSRFNGVRLVCRLRRSSAPASGVPTGPSAMVGLQAVAASPPVSPRGMDGETGAQANGEASTPTQTGDRDVRGTSTSADKYFIVKSLTLQDLELSVRNGMWATQSHNEETLNKAFEAADNVYLIFSANKSGEYFGYARMTSRILEDDGQLISSVPKPENILEATDVPKSIPTPATEHAPKGRIIDDSARGTIFWEAELTDSEGEEEHAEKEETHVEEEAPVVAQSWGKPFRIQWMSTNRLPFYRTRGLRNPWNANREVKIARDGTELEPAVGERLLQMFRGPNPAPMVQPQLGMHMRPF